MSCVFTETEKFRRGTAFPVNVSRLYICPRRAFPFQEREVCFNKYEITIRLDSDTQLCRDEIDGEIMNIPFPNVVFKTPGMRIRMADDMPREAIGFSYPVEHIAILRKWNMLPERKFMSFAMSPELDGYFNEIRKFSLVHPSLSYPGDRIDGVCFNILRELRLSSLSPRPLRRTPEMRIKEAELYMLHHFDEDIDLDELAARFGFSHSGFYQHWKKHHDCSPHRYVEELKLGNAAAMLLETGRSAAEIARAVGFSGITLFYRRFRERFGATPKVFRQRGKGPGTGGAPRGPSGSAAF